MVYPDKQPVKQKVKKCEKNVKKIQSREAFPKLQFLGTQP
jgi:hypothetical protein